MSKILHKEDKSNREEVNTMMVTHGPEDGIHIPEISFGDSSQQSFFVSGLCQSLKNANQYRAGLIEKINNQLGNHSIYFRKKP